MNMQQFNEPLVDCKQEAYLIVAISLIGGIINHVTGVATFAMLMSIMLYVSVKILMVMR